MRHDWCRIFPDLVLVLCSQVALSQTQVIETITIATERFVIDPENIVLHSSTLLPGSQGVLIDGQVVSIDAQNDLFVDGTEIITHEHLYSPANSYGGTTAVAGLDTSISLQYGSRVSSVRRSDGPTSKIGFGSSMYSSPGSQSGPTTMGSSTGRLTLSQSGSKASNVQRYETQVTREEFIGHKSSSTGSLSSPSTSESDLDTFNSLTSSLAAPILTVPGSEATNAAQGPQNSASASRSASATLTPWTSGSLGSPRTGPSHHTAIATIQASKSTAHPRSQSASAWTSAIATPHGGATATSASSRGSRSSSASLLSPSITAGPTFSIPFASINPTGAIASSNAVALAGLLIAFSNDNRDRISAIIKDPVKKKNLIDNVHSLETMALQLHSDEGGSNPSCDQTGFLPPLVEDIGCMAKDLTALKGSLVVKNPEIAAIEGAIDAVGEEAEQVERDNEDDDDDDDDEEKTTSTDDGKKTATKYNGNTTTSQLRESTTVSKPDRRKTISTTLIESHISTSSSTIAVITAGLSSQTATRTSSIAGPVSEASYALNISPIYPLDAVLDESADVVAIALNVVGDALIAEFGNGTSVASGFTTRTTSKPNTSPSIKWTTSSSSIGSSSKPNSSLSATRTISPSSPAPDSELSYVLYTGSIYPQDVAFDEPASVTAVAFGVIGDVLQAEFSNDSLVPSSLRTTKPTSSTSLSQRSGGTTTSPSLRLGSTMRTISTKSLYTSVGTKPHEKPKEPTTKAFSSASPSQSPNTAIAIWLTEYNSVTAYILTWRAWTYTPPSRTYGDPCSDKWVGEAAFPNDVPWSDKLSTFPIAMSISAYGSKFKYQSLNQHNAGNLLASYDNDLFAAWCTLIASPVKTACDVERTYTPVIKCEWYQ